MRTRAPVLLCAIALAAWGAVASEVPRATTVVDVYPLLPSGALTFAVLTDLPDGVLVKSEGFELRQVDIEKAISAQPQHLQAETAQYAFFVAEEKAAIQYLVRLGRLSLERAGRDVAAMSEQEIEQSCIDDLTKDVQVADAEVLAFHQANNALLGGTNLVSVWDQIKAQLTEERRYAVVAEHLRTMARRMEVLVSSAWAKQCAGLAANNPVDRGRAGGKPAVAVFSGASCCGPDRMLPVLAEIRARYGDRVGVAYVEASRNQILCARYGVASIPTLVIFDSRGIEAARREGSQSADAVAELLDRAGAQLNPADPGR